MTAGTMMLLRRGILDQIDWLTCMNKRALLHPGFAKQGIDAMDGSLDLLEQNGWPSDDLRRLVDDLKQSVEGKRAAGNPDPPAA